MKVAWRTVGLLLLAACATPGPPAARTGPARATVVWATPRPGYELVLVPPVMEQVHPLDGDGQGTLSDVSIAPPGQMQFHYMLAKKGSGAWREFYDIYWCEAGGTIDAQVSTRFHADGTFDFAVRYLCDGCRLVRAGGEQRTATSLITDEAPHPRNVCCFDGPNGRFGLD